MRFCVVVYKKCILCDGLSLSYGFLRNEFIFSEKDVFFVAEQRTKDPEGELPVPSRAVSTGNIHTHLSGSNSSINSVTSTVSGNKEVPDTPLQFEVLKQQKEVWEAGIQM